MQKIPLFDKEILQKKKNRVCTKVDDIHFIYIWRIAYYLEKLIIQMHNKTENLKKFRPKNSSNNYIYLK